MAGSRKTWLVAVSAICAVVAVVVVVVVAWPAKAAGPAQDVLGSSKVFVHLFEWSWADVATECEEFLGPKGFSAVQVSPPMEHITGPSWWTRYQPVSYNLSSRSGNEAAFVDMVQRCKKAGVDIIADAVFNHIAAGSGVGTAGSPYGNRESVLYTQDDFHHSPGDPRSNCGVSNYQDLSNVQSCDLVGLPDLCTACPKVQKAVQSYLSKMLAYGVAGFRIDAAKHQAVGELKALLQGVPGGLPWVFQEVIGGAGEAVKPQMYLDIGEVTEFQYGQQLGANFKVEGKLKYLTNFGEQWGLLSPGRKATVFIDNHDTQRGDAQLTYKSGDVYILASIFMLAHPYGHPKVMSSYFFDSHDQGPPPDAVHSSGGLNCGAGKSWVCEHRRPEIANMVAWRTAAGDSDVVHFVSSDDGNSAAFCRGRFACVGLNRGGKSWSIRLKVTVPSGQYCEVLRGNSNNNKNNNNSSNNNKNNNNSNNNNINNNDNDNNSDFSDCSTVTVDGDGFASIQVPALSAVAFHIHAKPRFFQGLSFS
ncbi:unnamed protein product [Polarella glacialis]|uniref:Alpha-amylase n=1 Tax=Polarella glacialis TaxID=89957 RepID=A0A813KLS8_POLGL|nr:unnamed protein product [Polarella glacialis]